MTTETEENGRKVLFNRLLLFGGVFTGLLAFLWIAGSLIGFLTVTEKPQGDFLVAPQQQEAPEQNADGQTAEAVRQAVADAISQEQNSSYEEMRQAVAAWRVQSDLLNQQVRAARVQRWIDEARKRAGDCKYFDQNGICQVREYDEPLDYLTEQVSAWGNIVIQLSKFQEQPSEQSRQLAELYLEDALADAPANSVFEVEALKTDAVTIEKFRAAEATLLDILAAVQDVRNNDPPLSTVETSDYNAALKAAFQAVNRYTSNTSNQQQQAGQQQQQQTTTNE